MTLSVSDIRAAFPEPTLTPLAIAHGVPTYAALKTLQAQINSNAVSVPWHADIHGHLFLTLPTATYTAKAHAPFVVPTHPGSTAKHKTNATSTQIDLATQQHAAALRAYLTYNATESALRQQLIEACPKIYLLDLYDESYGFGLVSSRDILTHLWTAYGTITSIDLDANLHRLTLPWTPPAPIQDVFERLTQAASLANAGNAPIGEANLVRAGFNLIRDTGLFPLDCRLWLEKAAPDKTLVAFKAFFLKADNSRRQTESSLAPTTGTAGFHSANATPTTTTSPHTIAQLEATIAQLKLAAKRHVSTPTHSPDPAAPPSYCWTHGLSSHPNSHSSANCKRQAAGHQTTATSANKLGGSTKNWTSTGPVTNAAAHS